MSETGTTDDQGRGRGASVNVGAAGTTTSGGSTSTQQQAVGPATQMITAEDALRQIAAFLPENYRVYFLTGIVDLRTIRQQYPDADTSVPANVRSELRELRRSVLSRSLDTGLANKYLTGAGGGRGGARANVAQGIIDRVIVSRTQPDPLGRTGSEGTVYSDPLGRPTVGLGFGRGERTYDYGDIELQALGGDVAEGIAAVTGGTTTPSDDGAVTDIAETPADINIPEDWRNAAAEAYPQYYAIVRNVPEIARLLEEAIANSYTPEQFQAKLEQTSWWQQTTASAREWDINGQRDPATQQTLIDNKRVEVRNFALSAFGVQLSDEKLEQLTVDSLRFGWSYNFLQNAIGDVATQSTVGISQLRQGYIGQTIRQTARRYGVALADETFNSFVNRIAVGQETTDSFENYASNIARSLYPTLTAQFDSGLTFEDAVSPYRQVAANLLELNPNDIDFMDPKWLTPITYMPDPQSGEQRLMNLAEWGQELRTNKAFGYEFTNQARETAYRVTTDLANLFGRV